MTIKKLQQLQDEARATVLGAFLATYLSGGVAESLDVKLQQLHAIQTAGARDEQLISWAQHCAKAFAVGYALPRQAEGLTLAWHGARACGAGQALADIDGVLYPAEVLNRVNR